jgi:hypothetical protein
MNESTNFVLPDEIFTVFEFALGPVPHGSLRQKVRSLGDFRSVEDAFATAAETARVTAHALTLANPPITAAGAEPALRIVATEFGYDVKRTHQTLSRFWVHARPAGAGE